MHVFFLFMKTSFKLSGICGAAIVCCVHVAGVLACCGEDKPVMDRISSPTVIPATARVGNVQVGVTTMEELERLFGKGRAFTGGHPRGGREWRSDQTGWYIYADGFEYKDGNLAKGRMVESFEISMHRQEVGGPEDDDFKIHRTSVKKKQLTILGGITPRMERATVITLLAESGVQTTETNNVITWKEKGHAHIYDATQNHGELTYTTWNGTLTFRQNHLEDIDIECE
jgi:hypothetical protein